MAIFNKTVRRGSAATFMLFLLFCCGIYFFFMRDTEEPFVPYYYALDGREIYYQSKPEGSFARSTYILASVRAPHASRFSDDVPSEPFGEEAKRFVQEAIKSGDIHFEPVINYSYVYVWLGVEEKSSYTSYNPETIKNHMLNALMISKGYAKYDNKVGPSVFRENPTYKEVFLALQKEAQDKRIGIWSLPENSPEELAKAEARAKEQKIAEDKDKKRQQQEYLKEANKVVITSRGKKYHYDWCQTIKGAPKTITIKQARKRGYTPCGVCEPPDREVTLENSGVYWGDNVYRGEKVRLFDPD